MTVENYLQLTYEKRLAALASEGIYIGKLGRSPQVSLLYQLHSFYVEIFYSQYRREIASIRCSTCTSVLDPYFEALEAPLFVD